MKKRIKFFNDFLKESLQSNQYHVYHGTSAEFTDFRHNLIGSNTDGAWNGWGFYFSDNIAEAKLYGSTLLEAIITINKPFITESIDAHDSSIRGSGFVKLLASMNAFKDKKYKNKITYQQLNELVSELEEEVLTMEYCVSDGHREWLRDISYEYRDRDYDIRNRSINDVETEQLVRNQIISDILYELHEITSLPNSIRTSGIGSYTFSQCLIEEGYDGVIAPNSTVATGYEYVVFDTEQIQILK